MESAPEIEKLTHPRFVPFIIQGRSLAAWYDRQEHRYWVLCPQCHTLTACATLAITYRETGLGARKCCQGCRAKYSFEKSPGLIGLFLDFWCRTGGFPESASWLEAVPQQSFNFLAK